MFVYDFKQNKCLETKIESYFNFSKTCFGHFVYRKDAKKNYI